MVFAGISPVFFVYSPWSLALLFLFIASLPKTNKIIADRYLALGWLFNRQLHHCLLNMLFNAVLQHRLRRLISCSANSPPRSYNSLKR